MKKSLRNAVANITVRKLGNNRVQPKIRLMSAVSDEDDDKPELFTVRPSDEIPRNKLTENLARGL
jgi:hypothetical protein